MWFRNLVRVPAREDYLSSIRDEGQNLIRAAMSEMQL